MDIEVSIKINKVNHAIYNTAIPESFRFVGDFSTKDMNLINKIIRLIDERVKSVSKE